LELEDTETVSTSTSPILLTCLKPHLGLLAGMVIGLPPVLNFGSEELKKKVVPEVFSGKKFICLAISEAFAGSDVAGLKTTAEKTEDGSQLFPAQKNKTKQNVFTDPLPLLDRVLDRKWYQEVDHQWNFLGLFHCECKLYSKLKTVVLQ